MKIESTKKKFNTWLKGQYNNSDAVRIVWIIDEFDRYCLKAGYRNSSIYNINNYEELLLLELNSMGNNSKLNNYWIYDVNELKNVIEIYNSFITGCDNIGSYYIKKTNSINSNNKDDSKVNITLPKTFKGECNKLQKKNNDIEHSKWVNINKPRVLDCFDESIVIPRHPKLIIITFGGIQIIRDTSWKDAWIDVCNFLISKYPDQFDRSIEDSSISQIAIYTNDNYSEMVSPIFIENTNYILDVNISPEEIIYSIKCLMEMLHIRRSIINVSIQE